METTNTKQETKRIITYLVITFLITYLYCFLVVYPLMNKEAISTTLAPIGQLAISLVMFFPALSVLCTRLLTKEGFHDAWILPHLKGNIKTYLLAYFGPGLLVIAGAIIYFLIFPDKFDPDCSYLKATLTAAGSNPDISPMPLSTLMIIQGIQALLIGPVLNIFTCFGEEWGWRGYLLPKMSQKLSPLPMLLLNGIIWGLWHAPLTAIGHNYGTAYPVFPFAGIAAMCCFCIIMGIFLSYVADKAKSCIPAAIGHGALNSIASIGLFYTADGGNPFIGPTPTGIIGCIPFILVAVLIYCFYFSKKKN